MGEKYGYARVSSVSQNEHRQIMTLASMGISEDNIFLDKISGSHFERPQYAELMRKLKEGDELYIISLDRLGRNYYEIQNQWKLLTKELHVGICVVDMPILNTNNDDDIIRNFISDLVLQILSFVAQNEREMIHERQAQGIEAARARGTHLGRPRKELPNDFNILVGRWRKKEISLEHILMVCEISKSTFLRRVKEM